VVVIPFPLSLLGNAVAVAKEISDSDVSREERGDEVRFDAVGVWFRRGITGIDGPSASRRVQKLEVTRTQKLSIFSDNTMGFYQDSDVHTTTDIV